MLFVVCLCVVVCFVVFFAWSQFLTQVSHPLRNSLLHNSSKKKKQWSTTQGSPSKPPKSQAKITTPNSAVEHGVWLSGGKQHRAPVANMLLGSSTTGRSPLLAEHLSQHQQVLCLLFCLEAKSWLRASFSS